VTTGNVNDANENRDGLSKSQQREQVPVYNMGSARISGDLKKEAK
jgi:hypothetical protein